MIKIDKGIMDEVLEEMLSDELNFLWKAGERAEKSGDCILQTFLLAAMEADNRAIERTGTSTKGGLAAAILYEALARTEEKQKQEEIQKEKDRIKRMNEESSEAHTQGSRIHVSS